MTMQMINYECSLKGVLYCPGSGRKLLSALVINLVCHVSSVLLALKKGLFSFSGIHKLHIPVVLRKMTLGMSDYQCSKLLVLALKW